MPILNIVRRQQYLWRGDANCINGQKAYGVTPAIASDVTGEGAVPAEGV